MKHQRRFRVLEVLGKGAFGTVYRTELIEKGGFTQLVALKLLSYEGAESDDIGRRLRDEARMLGLIRHRAIVGVHSLAHLEQGWAVVMQYIDGADLSSVIASALPPLRVTVEVIEDVAGALHTAFTAEHEGRPLQLVHRDIKPSNIRVTAQGEVKLLDFGVARAQFRHRESIEQEGIVFGSLRYMAPERRRGVEGPEGDIYGVGLVLANLLTGRKFPDPPRVREAHDSWVGNILEQVKERLQQADDPDEKAATEMVVLLMLQLLAFEPDDRPQAKDLERQLRKIRSVLRGTGIKNWAETAIPKAQARRNLRVRDAVMEKDVGTELIEVSVLMDEPATDEAEASPGSLGRLARGGGPTLLLHRDEDKADKKPAPVSSTARTTLRPADSDPGRAAIKVETARLNPRIIVGALVAIAFLGFITLALVAVVGWRSGPGVERANGKDDDGDGFVDAAGPWEGSVGLAFIGEDRGAHYTYALRCPSNLALELTDPKASSGQVRGKVSCTFEDPIAAETFAFDVTGLLSGTFKGTEGSGQVDWELGALGPRTSTWTLEGDFDGLFLGFELREKGLSVVGSGEQLRPGAEAG